MVGLVRTVTSAIRIGTYLYQGIVAQAQGDEGEIRTERRPAAEQPPEQSPEPPLAELEWIYFLSNQPGQFQVYRMREDGSGRKQVTDSPEKKVDVIQCPGSDHVYYIAENSEYRNSLYRLGEDLESQVAIPAVHGHVFQNPHCSHDGNKLAVTHWHIDSGEGAILVYDAAREKVIRNIPGADSNWSPDDSKLIYVRYDMQGSSRTGFTAQRARVGYFSFDDGRSRELFAQDLGGDTWIYFVDEPKFVSNQAYVYWVYDEHEHMYYMGEIGGTHGERFVKTRNGGPFLTHQDYAEGSENVEQYRLEVSPDGTRVVYDEAGWGETTNLILVALSTRDSQVLMNFGYNAHFAADSQSIYFNHDPAHYAVCHDGSLTPRERQRQCERYPKTLDGYEIYIIDADGRNFTRLTENDFADVLPRQGR